MPEVIEYYQNIPSKSTFSYLLYLFPHLFILPIFRQLLISLAMRNCTQVDFEPGFRFYYGKNIHAYKVAFANTLIMDYASVTLGEGTAFTKDNKIITATHDPYDRKKILAQSVKIGKNVWITTNCIILGGVTIGDNSIIGAGSVVTQDIPANCIAAGNPCRVIKKLDEKKPIRGFMD